MRAVTADDKNFEAVLKFKHALRTCVNLDVNQILLTPLFVTNDQLMLHYSVIFLLIALVVAVFGFGGIAASAVEIAKILFFIFAIIAIVTFVISLVRKN